MHSVIEPSRLAINPGVDYSVRLAHEPAEVRAAQALRYAVFNVELHEGLAGAAANGLDSDPFDEVCDHLLVEHLPTNEIVGTYRLQPGTRAAAKLGYYSEKEFDFRVYEPLRQEIVELGRACVHKQHRNLVVLGLLWKGIADYATERGARYLCGCSSISSQDPAVGASMYTELCRNHLVEPQLRTMPLPALACAMHLLAEEAPRVPKLLRAYLAVGAKICGPPALDQEFKTIDFLTLLDLQTLPKDVRERFLS